jgi:phage tail-like protein
MINKIIVPELTLPPPVGYSFMVIFYGIGNLPIPNGLDIRFQSVSGISVSFETEKVQKGSVNDKEISLPGEKTHQSLILQRGLTTSFSPLAIELQAAVAHQIINKHDVHVILLNQMLFPIGNWYFSCAYPVKWSISDFDASQNQVVIETLEMKYSNLRTIIL